MRRPKVIKVRCHDCKRPLDSEKRFRMRGSDLVCEVCFVMKPDKPQTSHSMFSQKNLNYSKH